jgi:hypothetical protein
MIAFDALYWSKELALHLFTVYVMTHTDQNLMGISVPRETSRRPLRCSVVRCHTGSRLGAAMGFPSAAIDTGGPGMRSRRYHARMIA